MSAPIDYDVIGENTVTVREITVQVADKSKPPVTIKMADATPDELAAAIQFKLSKQVSLLVILFLFGLSSFAATITAAPAGGQWNLTATWVGSVVPTTTDTVIVNATCVSPLVMTASTTIKMLNCTGYANTLTINNGVTFSVGGNVTLGSAMTFTTSTGSTGTGRITFTANGTFTSNGVVMACRLASVTSGITITLVGDLNCSNLVTLAVGNSVSTTINATASEKIICQNGLQIGAVGVSTIAGSGKFEIRGGAFTCINATNFSNPITFLPSVSAITISHTGTFSYNGTITYTPSTFSVTHSAGSVLTINGNSTLNTNGITWQNITVSAAATITNNSLLTVANVLSLTLSSNTVTFTGTAGWITDTFSCTTSGVTLSLKNGLTYRVNTSITLHATLASPMSINSDDGSATTILNFFGQPANQSIWFVNPTRVNSSAGNALYSVGTTINSSINWYPLVARGNSIN